MKPDDVKPDTSIDLDFEVNRESSKFSVGDHIRISKKKKKKKDYKRLGKLSRRSFMIKNVKYWVPWIFVIEDPTGTFYELELKKRISQNNGLIKW